MDVEYGPQDFFGIIEEMRIWSRVRSDEEIYQSMRFDSDSEQGHSNFDISPNDKNLVAWWKFDEGKGYSVRDETGRGHTLRLLEEPNWVVSNTPVTINSNSAVLVFELDQFLSCPQRLL